MATFVLVPGYWLGGWAWADVAAALREAAHTVYPVTLTGLGDRAHLHGPHVNLDTHIADVAGLLRDEDLRDVVLVGHSYAANVITGAADAEPERIARLVYVDTWPLPAGMAMRDMMPPAAQAAQAQLAAENDGRLPLPPWEELDEGNELAGLGAAERERMRARAVGQPFGTTTQPVGPRNPAAAGIPRTAIWCSMSIEDVRGLIEAYPHVGSTLAEPGWEFVELPTGHWPMFSRPRDLAEMLAGLA